MNSRAIALFTWTKRRRPLEFRPGVQKVRSLDLGDPFRKRSVDELFGNQLPPASMSLRSDYCSLVSVAILLDTQAILAGSLQSGAACLTFRGTFAGCTASFYTPRMPLERPSALIFDLPDLLSGFRG